MSFLRQSEQEYVLICHSRFAYNIDFTTALRFHQNTGDDITMVYHIENKERPDNATIYRLVKMVLLQKLLTVQLFMKIPKYSWAFI